MLFIATYAESTFSYDTDITMVAKIWNNNEKIMYYDDDNSNEIDCLVYFCPTD